MNELNFGQKVAEARKLSREKASFVWSEIKDKGLMAELINQHLRLLDLLDRMAVGSGLAEPKIEVSPCVAGINPDAWTEPDLGRPVQSELLVGREMASKLTRSGRDGDGLHKRILASKNLLGIRSGAVIRISNGGQNEWEEIKIVILDEVPDGDLREGLEKYHGCLVFSSQELLS